MLLAQLSPCYLLLPPQLTSQLCPSGAELQVGGFVWLLGSSRPLQWTLLRAWEFLPPSNPPQDFIARGSESLVSQSAGQPAPPPPWSLPPCCGSSPLGCLSLPLLPVWMNVFLTPRLSEVHAVWFYTSSGCFMAVLIVFKLVVILLLVVRGSETFLVTSCQVTSQVSADSFLK